MATQSTSEGHDGTSWHKTQPNRDAREPWCDTSEVTQHSLLYRVSCRYSQMSEVG
jgi:hypothetical protein